MSLQAALTFEVANLRRECGRLTWALEHAVKRHDDEGSSFVINHLKIQASKSKERMAALDGQLRQTTAGNPTHCRQPSEWTPDMIEAAANVIRRQMPTQGATLVLMMLAAAAKAEPKL